MRDAAADRITREMVKAIGGEGALDRTRTIRFLFGSSVRDTARGGRRHWWDRTTGVYRIEGTTQAGQVYVLIFNTETREGKAWLDGEPMEGEELDRYLERAYAIYINDTYWFLMPHKMLDPGVRLAYDGEAIVDGSTCDRIRVTFDSVGLTPGDTYWAYIDPKTHLMKRWGFILGHQRQDPDATERLYDWTGWTYYGGLRLATQRPAVDSPDRRIVLCTGIQVDQAFPGDVFTNPRPIGF